MFRFVIISSVIFDLQEFTIPQIKAKDISFGPYSIKFLAKINIFWNRKQWICLMIFWPRIYKCKKCKIAYFLRNHIFRFLIISLVIFVLQECTIPQIKAKDISFGPYSFSFLAKINILWERKQQSCLVFFYPDLIIKFTLNLRSETQILMAHALMFQERLEQKRLKRSKSFFLKCTSNLKGNTIFQRGV